MNVFETSYGWLKGFYGQDMYDFISGYDCSTMLFDQPCYFPQIGMWTLIIAAAFAVVYYFLINHPRFNRWWSWLIMLAVNAIAAFSYGFAFVSRLVNNVTYDISCMQIEPYYFNFGLANAIIATMFFFLISLIIKRFSRNCKHSPFKSLFPKN